MFDFYQKNINPYFSFQKNWHFKEKVTFKGDFCMHFFIGKCGILP